MLRERICSMIILGFEVPNLSEFSKASTEVILTVMSRPVMVVLFSRVLFPIVPVLGCCLVVFIIVGEVMTVMSMTTMMFMPVIMFKIVLRSILRTTLPNATMMEAVRGVSPVMIMTKIAPMSLLMVMSMCTMASMSSSEFVVFPVASSGGGSGRLTTVDRRSLRRLTSRSLRGSSRRSRSLRRSLGRSLGRGRSRSGSSGGRSGSNRGRSGSDGGGRRR